MIQNFTLGLMCDWHNVSHVSDRLCLYIREQYTLNRKPTCSALWRRFSLFNHRRRAHRSCQRAFKRRRFICKRIKNCFHIFRLLDTVDNCDNHLLYTHFNFSLLNQLFTINNLCNFSHTTTIFKALIIQPQGSIACKYKN